MPVLYFQHKKGLEFMGSEKPKRDNSAISQKTRVAMTHQKQALRWARTRKNIALFMEMRLGKTLVAIRWTKQKKPDRVLILAPAATLPGWVSELKLEGITPTVLEGSRLDRVEQAQEKDGYFLLNYEGLLIPTRSEKKSKKVYAPIARMDWDVVIVDESARIKNPQSKLSAALRKWLSDAPRKCIMSGRPDPETPLDYFCQMAFLFKDFMGCQNWWQFRAKHYANVYAYEWIPRPNTITKIKTAVH